MQVDSLPDWTYTHQFPTCGVGGISVVTHQNPWYSFAHKILSLVFSAAVKIVRNHAVNFSSSILGAQSKSFQPFHQTFSSIAYQRGPQGKEWQLHVSNMTTRITGITGTWDLTASCNNNNSDEQSRSCNQCNADEDEPCEKTHVSITCLTHWTHCTAQV